MNEEEIKARLKRLKGMGERITIISQQITIAASTIEALAKKYDKLNELSKMKRVEIKLYSATAYDRASFTSEWPGEIDDLKEILKERIRAEIQKNLDKIEELKKEL